VTPQQIVAVALRIFAVWWGIQTLRTIPSLVRSLDSPSHVWWTFMLGLYIAIMLTLWFFPRTIAGKLVPPSDEKPQPPATPDVWLTVGCMLIGLWVLTTTLPRLVYDLITVNAVLGYDDRYWILPSIAEVAVAIWLTLGARGVRKLYRWAQYVGVRKDL
jgi:hypothetical protein